VLSQLLLLPEPAKIGDGVNGPFPLLLCAGTRQETPILQKTEGKPVKIDSNKKQRKL
jgi:hypothetical protein